MYEFKVNPARMEKIHPIRHNPKWKPDVELQIARKKEEAADEDELAREEIRVYSDGSAIDGGVGAAAILMRDGEVKDELRFYLGKDSEHTVYEGELVGMILAVELIRRAGGGESMALGVDNQAAIRATKAFNSQPGHHLMDTFHDSLREIIPDNNGKRLVVRWTPGHVGIPGNEKADERAKRAARKDVSEGRLLPKSLRTAAKDPITLPISKSSTLQQFRERIKEEAAKIMHLSPRFAALQTIDPTAPSKHFAGLIDQFPRRHSSLLFQLRTGHIPLNKHLHRIAKSETATCQQCNEGNESVHHFLLTCPAYTRQRNILRQELGTRAHHVKHILNDAECLKSLFTFIAKTKRFEPTFGDVSPPKDKNDKNS
jgi:ribonuclease HI